MLTTYVGSVLVALLVGLLACTRRLRGFLVVVECAAQQGARFLCQLSFVASISVNQDGCACFEGLICSLQGPSPAVFLLKPCLFIMLVGMCLDCEASCLHAGLVSVCLQFALLPPSACLQLVQPSAACMRLMVCSPVCRVHTTLVSHTLRLA